MTTRDITYRRDGTGCTWEELIAAFKEGRKATLTHDSGWVLTGVLWNAEGWGVGPTRLYNSGLTITVHDVPAPHWSDDEPLVVAVGNIYFVRWPDGTYSWGPQASCWTPAEMDAKQWDPIPVVDRHGRWMVEQ